MTQSVALDETSTLISADKVGGTGVFNTEGEKLGNIQSIMIDKTSGHVAYAVMSFGGFLGMGERYHPLPWAVLTYDVEKGGYVVPLSKEKLQRAPTYAAQEVPRWNDPAWHQEVHGYYGAMPTWPM